MSDENHFTPERLTPELMKKLNETTRGHLDPQGKLDPDKTMDIGALTERALRERGLNPDCLPKGSRPQRPFAKPDRPGVIERLWSKLTNVSGQTPRG